MSTITLPTFTGQARLKSQDVDSAFAAIAGLLSGGIEADNLAAGPLFAPLQIAEAHTLTQISVTLTAVSKYRIIPMAETSTVVGWSVSWTPGGSDPNQVKVVLAQVEDPRPPFKNKPAWTLEHLYDRVNDAAGDQRYAFNSRGLARSISKGQFLMFELYTPSGSPVVTPAFVQVLLKRRHVKG